MKRRHFVRSAIAAGLSPAALPSSSVERILQPKTPKNKASVRKPRIFFFHDSRHPLMYMYEPPIQKEEVESAVDELVETSVDALMFCLGDGRTIFHNSKVGEIFGHNVQKWPLMVFQRAHQNTVSLLDSGIDQLRLICQRAHQKDMLIYPALLVNQGRRGPREQDVRSSNFRFDNEHLEIGAQGDLESNFPGLTCLDFKHQKVRKERFDLILEVIKNYPIDGFELTLSYQSPSPHFFHPKEVSTGRSIMTSWIKQIYESLKQSGRNRELAIRIPGNLKTCFDLGLDVNEWIRLGIVDLLIPETYGVYWGRVDHSADYRPLVRAAKGTQTRIAGVLNSMIYSDRLSNASIEIIRGAACNYWEQGIDGIYLNQWFQGSNWPYRSNFYEQLREISHPDIMAPKDKIYLVPTAGNYKSPPWEPPMLLPQKLEVKKPIRFNLPISDDLNHWEEVKRLHKILLRFRIMNTNQVDQITFRLNEKNLPTSSLRKINQIYRMSVPNNSGFGFGYWFIYELDKTFWPKKGKNWIEIILDYRDPQVIPEITLHDIEMEIRYLKGKNFHRNEDPDLGPSLNLRDLTINRS